MSDLFIDITYPIDKPSEYVIKSDIKARLLSDFMLDNVLRGLMGSGSDGKKVKKKKVYHIRITCNLAFDVVSIEHDCGSDGLMTGIVMDVTNRIIEKEETAHGRNIE